MSTDVEIELQASALACSDAISAVIACLANTGALHPAMFKEAIAAIKDLTSVNGSGLKDHVIYERHMKIFVAAAEKRL